jgi:hypothetical protein
MAMVAEVSSSTRAARTAHDNALKLAERIGRYSERLKFLRSIQGAKQDMRSMRDTIMVYSRAVKRYREQHEQCNEDHACCPHFRQRYSRAFI